MKNIITSLLLLACYTSDAQVYSKATNYGNELMRIMADSTFHPPFRSKNTINMSIANRPAIICATEDSLLYLSKGFGLPYNIPVGIPTNMANTNLVATGDRQFNWSGKDWIMLNADLFWVRAKEFSVLDSVSGTRSIQVSDGHTVDIGDVQNNTNGTRIQVTDVGQGINMWAIGAITTNTPIWNFVNTTTIYTPNLNTYASGSYYPLVWNQATMTFEKCTSCTFGGGGTNLATADQTATADRTHDWDGFDFIINDIDRLQFAATQSIMQGNFTAGDAAGVGIGTKIDVKPGTDQILLDGETKIETSATFIVRNNTGDKFLDFNMSGKTYNIGDLDATNNNTVISIDDNNADIINTSDHNFVSQTTVGDIGLMLDYSHNTYGIGDYGGLGNNTLILINDLANTIQLKSNGVTTNPETDSTAALETGSGLLKKYYQPYIYKKITGSTNGSTSTSTILTTANRTTYRIQVDYVGKNGSQKSIAGTKQAVYYGGASVLTVCTPTDIQPEGVLNMNASGYCNIVTSGGDINVEFNTNAADGAIDWDIIVRIKVY